MSPSAFCATCAFLPVVAFAADVTSLPVRMDFDPSKAPTLACDVAENGDVYAVGSTWKMVFTESGATFIAILGESAPRNMGLHFAFPGLAKPHLDGNRVTIDRGAFTEVYDLAPSQVEQSFVISQRAHDGDLVMRIPLATELVADGRDSNGLRFVAPDLGAISYGNATTIDAAGRSVGSEPRLVAGAIEIVVPDAYLDRAEFPLIIDPVITTFNVDASIEDAEHSDAVFSAATNTFVVVYQLATSSGDHDILLREFDAAGQQVSSVLIDGGTANTIEPTIAERAGAAMIVYAQTGPGAAINARRYGLTTGTLSAASALSATGAILPRVPDVGATPQGVTRPYLAVWREVVAATTQIRGVLFNDAFSSKVFVNDFCVLATVHDEPTVTQFAPAGGHWVVAYTHQAPALSANYGLGFCKITTTGTNQGGTLVMKPEEGSSRRPRVCHDGADGVLLTWIADLPTGSVDLLAKRYVMPTGDVGPTRNVGQLDRAGGEAVDQLDASATFDGSRFVIAYSERNASGTHHDVRASVWGNGIDLPLALPGVVVANSLADETEVATASAGVASPNTSIVTWTKDSGGIVGKSVLGALFSSIGVGGTTTVQTGCGSPEPLFITSTPVIFGGSFNVSIIGSPAPILVVGPPTSVALCPAQSASCLLGATPLVVSPVPFSFSVTVPVDATLAGVPIAMQVLDVLPPNATGPLCGPPKYTQKFRVSDTRVITIQ